MLILILIRVCRIEFIIYIICICIYKKLNIIIKSNFVDEGERGLGLYNIGDSSAVISVFDIVLWEDGLG